MTRKQQIYTEMLRLGLTWIRNVQTWHWWQRIRDRSCYFESELIHNLPDLLSRQEIDEPDIWFLNQQAKIYIYEASEKTTPNYKKNSELINELFSLAKADYSYQLEWPGPAGY